MSGAWWKGAILYHVYVRSFFDSDADGQGDLAGLEEKLDYIAGLGVDGIWLSPIHPSPDRDWGYDVSDFEDVHPDYGTLEDFDRLLDAAHARCLKVVLDEVLAHTSDEHAWFIDSLTGGPDGEKADWYVWADPRADGTAPNNWLSVFGGPAWAYQPHRRQHYHHKFLRQQPKLNWRSPGARAAALEVLDYWLEKGVDGFRLDVAGAYLHDDALTDNPAVAPEARNAQTWSQAATLQRHIHDANLPENAELLDAVRRRVEAFGDRFVFGEFFEEEARGGAYLGSDEGLHSAYTFVLLTAERMTPRLVRDHYAQLASHPGHWPTISFSNHDVPRAVSRLADGSPEAARMLLGLLATLRGTVLIYQGEELGLPQAKLSRHEQRDPVGDLYWPYAGGRDGARTPMPWTDDETLGFSKGEAWLTPSPLHQPLSVAAQDEDEDSTLNFARAVIALRQDSQALRTGEIIFLDAPEPALAFVRREGDEAIACVFNMSDAPCIVEVQALEGATLLELRSGEAELRGASLGLSPYGAAFVKL